MDSIIVGLDDNKYIMCIDYTPVVAKNGGSIKKEARLDLNNLTVNWNEPYLALHIMLYIFLTLCISSSQRTQRPIKKEYEDNFEVEMQQPLCKQKFNEERGEVVGKKLKIALS